MKHKSPDPTGERRPRVHLLWVLAPLVGIMLVSVLALSPTWNGSGPGAVATEAPRPQAVPAAEAATEASTAEQKPSKGKDGKDGKDGKGNVIATADLAPDAAALEKSMRKFRAARKRLAAKVSRQVERQSSRQVSRQAQRSEPVTFRVASFNVLGDSHTGPGGNKPGFPDGGPRMDMAISALRNNGIDVVGFQEFEASQYAMFTARAGEYSLYPGLSLGTKSVRFNIAWRSSMWRLVEAHTLSIPYAGGSRIAMPVVLLESTTTGRQAWFANFHNPADTPSLGNNARWRAEAAGIEVAHLTSLHADGGVPVISTGDYNERAEIFCRFTAGGVFSAAAGGSTGGSCAPPARMEVDWIFGSKGVAFDGYAVTDTGKASDHRMVHSSATLVAVE